MTEPVYMRVWRHRGKSTEVGFKDVLEAEGRKLIDAGVAQDAKTTSAMDLLTIALEHEDGNTPPTRTPEYATREMKPKTRRGEPRS